jgi:Domain of unknown function (DUF4394)
VLSCKPFRRLSRLALLGALALVAGIPSIAPQRARAAAATFAAAGANAAAIQAAVDQFRTALGTLNPNAAGSFGAGRREINWDGVPDSFAAPTNLPNNFFNVNSPRGVVFTTPGTGIQVSADTTNPTTTPVRFGNINSTYTGIFTTFSPERLFTPLGNIIMDVAFFIPGSDTPATVSGFGAVFSDIDSAGATTIEYFDQHGASLGIFTPAIFNGGLSFYGVAFNAGERVARVRITSGNSALGPDESAGIDVVALDDFIYGEPQPLSVQPETIYAMTSGNKLLRFSSATPGLLTGAATVTGLQSGETILGIDFRPATAQLYALGSSSRLYTINLSSGAATAVGAGPFSPSLVGTAFGFDCNPVVDRFRVVSDVDQNMRLNPTTGALVALDSTMAYAVGDAHASQNPNVVGAAYTNNVSGTTSTSLYGIDSNLDILVVQNPPNAGVLNTVGSLGVDTGAQVGFDIAARTGVAFASLTAPAAISSQLYTINLNSGAATLLGTIGGAATVRDIAVVPRDNDSTVYLPLVRK